MYQCEAKKGSRRKKAPWPKLMNVHTADYNRYSSRDKKEQHALATPMINCKMIIDGSMKFLSPLFTLSKPPRRRLA